MSTLYRVPCNRRPPSPSMKTGLGAPEGSLPPPTLRTVVVLALAAAFLLASPISAGIGRWSGSGPWVADVRSVAPSPHFRDVLAVGTHEAIWRSVDDGATWIRTLHMSGQPFRLLVWSPSEANTLFAGNRSSFLFVSHDLGWSWSQIAMPGAVLDLSFSPTDPRVMTAALEATPGDCGVCPDTPNRLARSMDGGFTWVPFAEETSGVDYFAVAVDPRDPSILYLGSSSSIWKTTDDGAHWQDITPAATESPFRDLALIDQNVLAGGDAGLFKSHDGGIHWRHVEGSPEGIRHFAPHPINHRLLLAATASGLYRTTDLGETWDRVRDFGGSVASWDARFDPLRPRRVLAATSGDGLLRSEDQGTSWQILDISQSGYLHDGYPARIRDLITTPGPPVTLYAATASGGVFASTDGGRSWRQRNRGLGTGSVSSLAAAPSDGRALYASSLGGFYRTFDGGATWSKGSDDSLRDFGRAWVDPQSPRHLFLFAGRSVFESVDAGDTWAVVPGLPAGPRPRGLAMDPQNPQSVYLLFEDRLEISRDGGLTWVHDNSGLPEFGLESLSIAPDRPSVLYLTDLLDAVYKSTDRGQTWNLLVENLCAGSCQFLREVRAATAERLVAVGYERILLSHDGGTTWTTIPETLDAVDLALHPWAPSTLFVSGSDHFVERTEVNCDATGSRCFADGRFLLEMGWHDFSGGRGLANALPLPSADSAVLWFFRPDNWEVLAKVIDGRNFNHRYWVFAGAATNVETVLRVTDTESGRARSYYNPSGQTAASLNDIEAFPETPTSPVSGPVIEEVIPLAPSPAAERRPGFDPGAVGQPCVPSDEVLCFLEGRFQVEARWSDFYGQSGAARVVPIPDGFPAQDDSGLLWFFAPENWELLVKVIDGCGFNGHHWIFTAATTNVGYTLTVTDRSTGEVIEYSNPLGQSAPTVTDIEALEGCVP